jgi:ABC-type glutathione transport system ATPase component
MTDLVRVTDLTKSFPARGRGGRVVDAVRGVSLHVGEGESLGLVGESGSGKTTTARIVCGIENATSGEVVVAGHDLMAHRSPPRKFYEHVQMIFQDPYLSLSPRMSIRDAVGYLPKVNGVARDERERMVRDAVARVGLPGAVLDRYPHELSTGQRQRVGIARAVIGSPSLIVADEPVSSLDVSLQTQILNLLVDIQEQTGVSYLFISHDLAVVGYLCDRVMVMRGGEICEQGDTAEVLSAPTTDYSRKLIEAAGLSLQPG